MMRPDAKRLARSRQHESNRAHPPRFRNEERCLAVRSGDPFVRSHHARAPTHPSPGDLFCFDDRRWRLIPFPTRWTHSWNGVSAPVTPGIDTPDRVRPVLLLLHQRRGRWAPARSPASTFASTASSRARPRYPCPAGPPTARRLTTQMRRWASAQRTSLLHSPRRRRIVRLTRSHRARAHLRKLSRQRTPALT